MWLLSASGRGERGGGGSREGKEQQDRKTHPRTQKDGNFSKAFPVEGGGLVVVCRGCETIECAIKRRRRWKGMMMMWSLGRESASKQWVVPWAFYQQRGMNLSGTIKQAV